MTMFLDDVPRVGRKSRRPVHTFNLKACPMTLQPMMLAPVLPGDTMQNLLLQSRVVTKPVKNPLIGWWQEYYFFYVKHSQLDESVTGVAGSDEAFKNMHLDIEADMSAYDLTADNANHYTIASQGIAWMTFATRRVLLDYFREEGETYTTYGVVNNAHPVALNSNSWLDSVRDATTITDGGDLGDLEAAAEDIELDQLDRAFRTWQHLRAHQLTNASYEDYLKSHDIRGKLVEDPKKCELLRYTRDWTYPSNTIDPADGSPSSALSWAVTERADKNRFFAEPGFIVGYSVTRPKLYLAKQKAQMAQWLDNALMWLPAIMRDDPYTSLREFTNAQGPLSGNVTNGYWVDMADLYRYGDQFVNYDIDADATGVGVDLPTAALVHQYPTEAMVDTLFVDGESNQSETQDGIVSLNISSAVPQEIT